MSCPTPTLIYARYLIVASVKSTLRTLAQEGLSGTTVRLVGNVLQAQGCWLACILTRSFCSSTTSRQMAFGRPADRPGAVDASKERRQGRGASAS
jgi:hypothetical protein